jgi:hypothetical protein
MKRTWKETVTGYAGPITLLIVGIGLIALLPKPAHSADLALGGACCQDLEERVAELEATTARKGNRKVQLTVSGVLSEAWQYVDIGSFHKNTIGPNGNDETFVAFNGTAVVNPDISVGFKLEIDYHQLGLLGAPVTSDRLATRQSYFWVKSKTIGEVDVGKISQATQDFDKIAVDHTYIAQKPLSFGSVSDAYFSGADTTFDGHYRDGVRFTSRDLWGFALAGSIGPSTTLSGGEGSTWDVALTYGGEPVKDFRAAGGVGYRHDTDYQLSLLGLATISIPTGNADTVLASGSLMHAPSGLFIDGEWARTDFKDFNVQLEGLELRGGIQAHLVPLGHTTVFGGWGRYRVSAGGDADLDFFGGGIVQDIDSAAMSLYVNWRRYQQGDILSTDADVVTAGARVAF